jgi:membrane-bound lytic murein transglycosylase A
MGSAIARSLVVWLLLLAMLPGCATPLGPVANVVPVASAQLPDFRDDLDVASLNAAAAQSLAYYRAAPADRIFAFGGDRYTAAEMADSMARLVALIETNGTPEAMAEVVRREFVVYQSVGQDGRGTVQMSAYYEHTLEASLAPTETCRWPVYGRPADLVGVDLGIFRPVWQGEKTAGRIVGTALVPYYSRTEINGQGVLAGRGLEIAWAKDPVDIFLLQMEGSGWLRLPDRAQLVRIRFAATNGRPYRSVARHLVERGLIPEAEANFDAVVGYLRSHPDERDALLAHNERYVFFQLDEGPRHEQVLGHGGMVLTPGRSIAVDPARFPLGSLGWIESDGPHRVSRFVLSQDEGAAIKGPGRLDLFAGAGEAAERFATGFWQTGRLYFLVKKR